MKKKIENYKRKDLFEHYDRLTKPYASITTKIDVTPIYELSKRKGHFYATLGFCLTEAMCEIEEFRVIYEDDEFYLCDTIVPSYTDVLSDGTIGFYDVPLEDSYEDYLSKFDELKKKRLEGIEMPCSNEAVVWLSCEPWFKATAIDPPFDKNKRVPQLIWDKYEKEGDKYYVNLLIFFHHGFVDGFHIGKLIENIDKNIADIAKKYLD